MEVDILDCLQDLPYGGACGDADVLRAALDQGVGSGKFRCLVSWLVDQIHRLSPLEEPMSTPAAEDTCDQSADASKTDEATNGPAEDFELELSAVLREIYCPHSRLTQGPTRGRLDRRQDRLLLLDFLCGELQAARMLAVDQPASGGGDADENRPANQLKQALMALNFPKPPAHITCEQLFAKLDQKLKSLLSQAVWKDRLGTPLWLGELSDPQWRQLEELQSALQQEYRLRRQMMLTRLDVTIQSFRWSPLAQAREQQVLEAFRPRRSQLKAEPSVEGLVDLLAARDDLAVEERTCSSRVRANTRTKLNQVLIGDVPDRGGRCSEQAPPPPEMPSWKPRQAPPPGGAGGRGGNFRGGGRVQGAGWNRGGRGRQQQRRN